MTSSFSYAKRHQEEVARQSQSNQPYYQSLNANATQRNINANKAGSDLLALSEFSTTLTNHLAKRQEEKNKQDYLEYVFKGYQQGFPEEEVNTYKESISELNEDRVFYDNKSNEALKNGASYQVAEKISELSGWKAYGLAVGQAKSAADNFGAYLSTELQNSDAQTFEDRLGAIAVIEKNYLSQFDGWNPMLLNEHLMPGMKEATRKIKGEIIKQDRIDKSFLTQRAAFEEFASTNDLTTLIRQLNNTVDSSGKLLGMSGAWKLIDNDIKQRADNGTIFQDDLDNMKKGVPTHGGGKTYGDLFETKFDEWEETIKTEAYTNEETQQKIDKQNHLKPILEQIKEGKVFNNEEKKQLLRDWPTELGPVDPIISSIVTSEEKIQVDIISNLTEKWNNGDTIELHEVIPITNVETRGVWLKRVNNNEKKLTTPTVDEQTIAKTLIGTYVDSFTEESDAQTRKTTRWHTNYLNAYEDYLKLFKEYSQTSTDRNQAQFNALEEVKRRINTKVKEKGKGLFSKAVYTYDTLPNSNPKANEAREISLTLAAEHLAINPDSINTEILTGTEEIVQEAMRLPLGVVHHFYKQLSPKVKKNALALQQKQIEIAAKSAGLDKPIKSPILVEFEKLEPTTQELLSLHPSKVKVMRAVIHEYGKDGDVSYNDVGFLIDEVLDLIDFKEKVIAPSPYNTVKPSGRDKIVRSNDQPVVDEEFIQGATAVVSDEPRSISQWVLDFRNRPKYNRRRTSPINLR